MNRKIQLLRGFAICAVLIIHTNGSDFISVLDRPFLNFAVALFLFCSGYLTKLPVHNVSSFYFRRLTRTLIPYSVWTLIYTVLRSSLADASLSDFFPFLWTGSGCFVFYFIFVYIQFVLLTPVIGWLASSRFRSVGYAITPISILFARYLLPFTGISTTIFSGPKNILMWFLYYYLGLLLSNHIIQFNWSFKKCSYAYAVTLLLSLCEGFFWYSRSNIDMATTQLRLTSILTSTGAVLLSYLFLTNDALPLKDNKFNKVMLVIGNYSFGIFLSHIAVRILLSQTNLYNILPFPLQSIILFCTTFLLIFIAKKLLKESISRIFLGF